jgi:hypothetical protein
MRKYGSANPMELDDDGNPVPLRRTASRPLTSDDVSDIEYEDGPAVQEPEE